MKKTVPFTLEQIEQIAQTYPTPFHIYDEQAIRDNARRLTSAFSWAPEFQEYFAVKAAPQPIPAESAERRRLRRRLQFHG